MIFFSENRLHEAGYFYAISQSSKLTVGFVQIPGKGQISTATEQLGSFEPDMILLYADQEYTELFMQQVIIKMFIFTDSCTCHPFSGFLPVLAVFRQCFGYFLFEYQISRVPFSVDIKTNDVNFPVISIS